MLASLFIKKKMEMARKSVCKESKTWTHSEKKSLKYVIKRLDEWIVLIYIETGCQYV